MGDSIETTRTAAAEGVRVDKTIATGPDDAAVVTLGVALERDEPATVRITEPALGDVPRDQIELHTDHGAEHWQVGETATFERAFDAGESCEVVYRVTDVDADRFESLDEDPVVERAGASVDDLVDRGDSEAIRELVAGERESLLAPTPGAGGVELSLESGAGDAEGPEPGSEPGAETEPATASSGGPAEDTSPDEIAVDASPEELSVDVSPLEESEADDGTEPTEEPAVEADEPDEPEDDATDATDDVTTDRGQEELGASLAATPKGGLARVLLEELREGHVDDETRAALREELEPGRSRDVRIKHLQGEVAEFAAYVEMLDGFVDEYGTLDAVVGGMDEQVESLDDAVESVRSELDDLSESVEADVSAVESDVDAVEEDVDDLRDGHDDLGARVDELAAQLETVDERLDELDEFRERLSGAFQGVSEPES